MLREEFEQRWARKSVSLREMLSIVEERMGKLNGSMEDVKESLYGVKDRIYNWNEQSKNYVKMSLDSTMDKSWGKECRMQHSVKRKKPQSKEKAKASR
ncbi:hypothetical protein J1N35_008200 [Gossypium stocksii]|uniref:Uncharacterized protein n=1 Tax=Gossypium stocksii TaxID=47602 RepID=A0A9D4AE56_9ROSI|nr:hypothetical protein J1N35_008200 [Gossypium stocksii]